MNLVQIATNEGDTRQGGSIITTSGGNIYVFVVNSYGSSLYMHKSTDDGSTWDDTIISGSSIFGGTPYVSYVSAAIDGNGYIHVVVADTSGNSMKYSRLNTSNDSWDSWETAEAAWNTNSNAGNLVSLAIDSGNKPHVIYSRAETSSPYYYSVIYRNRVSGSWSSAETIYTGTSATYEFNVCLIARNSDILEAFYGSGYESYDIVPRTRTRTSGTWGTESGWTNCSGGIVGPKSIIVDGSGTVHRFCSTNSTNATLYDNDVSTGLTGIRNNAGSNWQSFSMNDTIQIATYEDNFSIYLQWNYKESGGDWTTNEAFITNYTVDAVITEYAYNFEYQVTTNYIFRNNTNGYLYFGTSLIPTDTNTSIHAFINSGTVSISNKSACLIGTGEILIPNEDIIVSGWVDEENHTILYPSLADNLDSTYAWYDDAPSGSYFEVGLSNPVGVPASYSHYIEWRIYKLTESTGIPTLKCELRQGNTTIASDSKILSSAVTTHHLTLTPAEVSNISDYTNLRFRITVIAISE